jgi:hypothetical protein
MLEWMAWVRLQVNRGLVADEWCGLLCSLRRCVIPRRWSCGWRWGWLVLFRVRLLLGTKAIVLLVNLDCTSLLN